MKYGTWTRNRHADGRETVGRWIKLLTFALLSIGMASNAFGQAREQAKRIHDRIAGVPPSDATLNTMEALVSGQGGTAIDAAFVAMQNPNFYNVTLKNFVAPWTNRDQNVFVPLNDYIATVIGLIRDDDTYPFNSLFSGDFLYVGNAGMTTGLFQYQQ